jgi:hypothetical protein
MTLCGLKPKDIINQWELNLIRKIIFIKNSDNPAYYETINEEP